MPILPYSTDALEPIISKRTMDLHYNGHLKGYVDKTNELIKDTEFENKDLEYICNVVKNDCPLSNNANQIYNHIFYFDALSIKSYPPVSSPFSDCVNKTYGGWDKFRNIFNQVCNELFGSGYVWVGYLNRHNKLGICPFGNAGNRYSFVEPQNFNPLFCIDLWEHAFYLDRYNKRNEYIQAFWGCINWDIVEERFSKIC